VAEPKLHPSAKLFRAFAFTPPKQTGCLPPTPSSVP
jgi:hypothetical protein